MNKDHLKNTLIQVAEGKITPEEAVAELKNLPYEDLGFAKIDNHRELRTGHPEVILCSGKTANQVAEIAEKMYNDGILIIGTKADEEQYEAVRNKVPEATYDSKAKMIIIKGKDQGEGFSRLTDKKIAVVTAGTGDIPIAEEAAITSEIYGNEVVRVYDVGVAGIHRLTDNLPKIREANVIIVIAGMEGALASVLGGLVDKPVIAVPTSIGYGASMGGLTALLSMLNSCSLGVSVMNIDNGFGAGYMASLINQL